MRTTICFFLFSLYVLGACSTIHEYPEATTSDKTPFKQPEAILSFDNESSFWDAVEKQRNGKDGIIATKSNPDFISIYDEFQQAMTEADTYYQKENGYEEFKKKFPNLFYPEHGEDYAAFLPVSDEAVAQLLNQQCKVMIAGEERDMRDVNSYEKIMELGPHQS